MASIYSQMPNCQMNHRLIIRLSSWTFTPTQNQTKTLWNTHIVRRIWGSCGVPLCVTAWPCFVLSAENGGVGLGKPTVLIYPTPRGLEKPAPRAGALISSALNCLSKLESEFGQQLGCRKYGPLFGALFKFKNINHGPKGGPMFDNPPSYNSGCTC